MTYSPSDSRASRHSSDAHPSYRERAKRPFVPPGFIRSGRWLPATGIVVSATGLSVAAVWVTGSLVLGGLIMLLTLACVLLASVMI
ncbi:hypothetical protein [Rhodococcus sp. NPDC058521]|uniref:hypothetical protein n=1 Tax=Rhodococcus sp. NPDC058521 TaxID=3346536 RepID=UPI003663AEED